MKRHPFHANGSEFADSSVSNIAATFCQCLSPTVSKLSTQDKNRQGVLVRHIQELAKKFSQICWFHALYIGGQGLQ